MEFDELRGRFGAILGIRIPPNGFEQTALERDREGNLAHKQLIRMVIAMYNYLEANAGHNTQLPTEETVQSTE